MHLVPTLVSTEINQNFAPAFSRSGVRLCSESTIRSGLDSLREALHIGAIGK